MDYSNNYSTTSYGAQGGAGGGGFMPGSQSESPSNKRTYGKDTLRPVTIKQLVDAHHPHPDSEYFIIDDSEVTQCTFVGQIRNISTQTTNVTYKVDDGTGIIEVKQWIDAEAYNNPEDPSNAKRDQLVEQGYARVWGRLKAFNNKRHVGAQIIRPVTDFNEIQYHLLEATAVHLHFSRGPPETLQNGADKGAMVAANGHGAQQNGGQTMGGGPLAGMSLAARKVYETIKNTPQTNEGLHVQDISVRAKMDIADAAKGGRELQDAGLIYTTMDDDTWAVLDV